VFLRYKNCKSITELSLPHMAAVLRLMSDLLTFSPLKASGKCLPAGLTISNSAFSKRGFCVILSINRDYFLKQRYPGDLRSGEVLCFLSYGLNS
jgi:hypothetical protein